MQLRSPPPQTKSLSWAVLLLATLLAAALQKSTGAPQQGCGVNGASLSKKASLADLTGAETGGSALSSRSLYMLPQGTLAQRLRAVASAATLARREDASLVVVWPEGGEAGFGAGWADLFEEPQIPVGPFPGGTYRLASAGCAVHEVASHQEFRKVHDLWEQVGGHSVLCLSSSASLVSDDRELYWFYKLLSPSKPVVGLETPFMAGELQWERWGQWIGIHACISPECAAAAAAAGTSLPKTSDYLALARHLAAMPLDGESVPRFYIVGDDAEQESEIQKEVWGLNLTGLKGTGAVLRKPHRLRPTSLASLQETVVDLHLLSKTTMIITSPGSAVAQAASAMGGAYILLAGESNTKAVAGMQPKKASEGPSSSAGRGGESSPGFIG